MTPLEAVTLVLAYVAQADGVISPEERQAIADVIPELMPDVGPREIVNTVRPLLAQGKQKLTVGRACLVLTAQPPGLRLATLHSALIVARSHERMSEEERLRLTQLARDLEIPDAELERLLTGRGA